jgi:2-keto-4-pentenoate hydratase
VDDRKADYNTLRHDILTLIADNAWNAGLVLGEPLAGIDLQRLGEISGVALIDGQEVGRGRGSDVLGHPLDALAWLANHLQARGLQLRQGDIIIGSQYTSAGSSQVVFMGGLGAVSFSQLCVRKFCTGVVGGRIGCLG